MLPVLSGGLCSELGVPRLIVTLGGRVPPVAGVAHMQYVAAGVPVHSAVG